MENDPLNASHIAEHMWIYNLVVVASSDLSDIEDTFVSPPPVAFCHKFSDQRPYPNLHGREAHQNGVEGHTWQPGSLETLPMWLHISCKLSS